jgi:hypothetical protein
LVHPYRCVAIVTVITLAALSLSGTIIDIAQTNEAGAVAEVTIANMEMNGPQDDGTYTLPFADGLIDVSFTWNGGHDGADKITVIPPAGFTCLPVDCAAVVPENGNGRVLIIPYIGF